MQANNTIPTFDGLQAWVARLDRRTYALIVGVAVGVLGGVLGLALAFAGPILTTAGLIGVLGALYVLTDVRAALYGLIITMLLLPFGTLPFKIVITPSLIDLALGAFFVVYLLQWMSGKRQTIQLTPVHLLITIYALWFVLSFALGLRYGAPTPRILREFVGSLLAIAMAYVLVDLIRDPATLRRLVLLVIVLVGTQALIALALYALPDALGERTLIRLARVGYPNGGVIRYVEDNPDLAERAIGTWVDPNVLAGALAIFAAMITPQVFAAKPVLRYRWLTAGVLGVVLVALVLTFSRASMLGFAAALMVMAALRYRKLLLVMILGGVLLLFLPQTQFYIERFASAFQGVNADRATQMRIGEYTDSINLIQQYPVFGVGFTGTPTSDVYTSVASMYLMMANQMGLIGMVLFLAAMAGVFIYGWRGWLRAKDDPQLDAIVLGYHGALIAVLTNSVVDMYFYRLDFQAPITLFWLTVSLALAGARLAQRPSTDSAAF